MVPHKKNQFSCIIINTNNSFHCSLFSSGRIRKDKRKSRTHTRFAFNRNGSFMAVYDSCCDIKSEPHTREMSGRWVLSPGKIVQIFYRDVKREFRYLSPEYLP